MAVKGSENYIISIDLGGTKILSALLNMKAEILFKNKVSTNSGNGRHAIIKSLVEAVNNLLSHGKISIKRIKAICIGIPGSVDPVQGKVGTAPNLGISNFLIRDSLKKYFPTLILIENDVNLAALGIKKFELEDDCKNALVVYVGTGIGGALIFNSKLYYGSNYFAGEIGHMKIKKGGPTCGCGNKGCFETIASRTAIVREIQKEMKQGRRSVLKDIVPRGKQIKSKSLAQAVMKNDKLVIKHVLSASEVIGTTLANITNLLNLDLIVLGGGVIEALGDFMLPKIKDSFKKAALKDLSKNVKILYTKLGDQAALLGGIALYEEYINGSK